MKNSSLRKCVFRSFAILMAGLSMSAFASEPSDSVVSVARYKDDKACALSLTFDDGLVEQYTQVAPELEKRGFRGSFCINGARINEDAEHLRDTTRMTWQQVTSMSERGHEMTNHGWRHKNFARFPLEELKEDILKNDSAIEAHTGIRPTTFFYPNNNKKKEGRQFAELNRVGTRTEQRSLGSKWTFEQNKAWIDGLIANKEWGVSMTHGLTYGYDAFKNPKRLWDVLDYVKANEKDIWVGTFHDVAAYVKERDNVKLEVSHKKNLIKVKPVLRLRKDLFNMTLTMKVNCDEGQRMSVKQDGKELVVSMLPGKAVFDFNPFGGTIKIKLLK